MRWRSGAGADSVDALVARDEDGLLGAVRQVFPEPAIQIAIYDADSLELEGNHWRFARIGRGP